MRPKLILIAIAALLAAGVQPASAAAAGPRGAIPEQPLAGAAGAELGVQRLTRDLGHVFSSARGRLVKLSRLGSVRAQDVPACNGEMAAGSNPRFTAVGAANRAGDIYCSWPPLTSPASLADRPYFRRAIDSRGYAVGDFQIGRVAGAESLGMGFPVRGFDGGINGVVFSSMSLGWLDRHVGGKRSRGALDVLVVDEHGTVLARTGRTQTRPGRNLAAKSLVREMLASDEGTGVFRFTGRKVISAFDVIRLTGGAVHVAVSVRP